MVCVAGNDCYRHSGRCFASALQASQMIVNLECMLGQFNAAHNRQFGAQQLLERAERRPRNECYIAFKKQTH
jgi:hypothetical protein